jgi:hypothetical protein
MVSVRRPWQVVQPPTAYLDARTDRSLRPVSPDLELQRAAPGSGAARIRTGRRHPPQRARPSARWAARIAAARALVPPAPAERPVTLPPASADR